jgi:hypothetical protein
LPCRRVAATRLHLNHSLAVRAQRERWLGHERGALGEDLGLPGGGLGGVGMGDGLQRIAGEELVGGGELAVGAASDGDGLHALGRGGDAGSEPVGVVALIPGGEGEHGAFGVGRGGGGTGAGDGDVVAGEGRHGVLLTIDAGGDNAILECRRGRGKSCLDVEEIGFAGGGVRAADAKKQAQAKDWDEASRSQWVPPCWPSWPGRSSGRV